MYLQDIEGSWKRYGRTEQRIWFWFLQVIGGFYGLFMQSGKRYKDIKFGS